jgi:hypothetical protein
MAAGWQCDPQFGASALASWAGQKARHRQVGPRAAAHPTPPRAGTAAAVLHHYALANTHGALAGSIGVVAAPLHGLRLARDTPWQPTGTVVL